MVRKVPKTFGARLKTTRKLQNLTQTELAERSGLTPAAISQLEAGDRLPAFKTLNRLAQALRASVSFLLGEENSEMPQELKVFFRDLQNLDADDVAKVKDYAEYLRSKSKDGNT